MILTIEVDAYTNHACLIGDSTNCNYYTMGNWTTGTYYPIIDPTYTSTPSVNDFNSIYSIQGYPTTVMICPDRSMTADGLIQQQPLSVLYGARSFCSFATQPLDAKLLKFPSTTLTPVFESCDSVEVPLQLANVGTSALISATILYQVDGVTQKTKNWTGNIATYNNTSVTGVKVGSSVSGVHNIRAIVTNPNGGIDVNHSNDSTKAQLVIYSTAGGSALSESFESAGIPSTWIIRNGTAYADNSSLTWCNAPFTTGVSVGYNSSRSAVLPWEGIWGQIREDYLTMPSVSFANMYPAMTFDLATAPESPSYISAYGMANNYLKVVVSEDCGGSWTTVYNKGGWALITDSTYTINNPNAWEFIPSSPTQWRHETVDLSAFTGNTDVIIRFIGGQPQTGAYGRDLYLDNINFITSTTGISEKEIANNITVYPNPAMNHATIDFTLDKAVNNVSIEIINAIGLSVLNKNLGRMDAGIQNYSLDVSSLKNGLYFLNIITDNKKVTKKIAISK